MYKLLLDKEILNELTVHDTSGGSFWVNAGKKLTVYSNKGEEKTNTMTKYFEIRDTPELKYAPRVKNLFGKFDIRNIRLETYPKLPKRQVFFIEPSDQNIFTDMILSPFLMISPTVMDVIRM